MTIDRNVSIRGTVSSESLSGQIRFHHGSEVLRRSFLKAFPDLAKDLGPVLGPNLDFESMIAELGLPSPDSGSGADGPGEQGTSESGAISKAEISPAPPEGDGAGDTNGTAAKGPFHQGD